MNHPPDDADLVACLQANAPEPPPPTLGFEALLMQEIADQNLVLFLQTYAPPAPATALNLEERLMTALQDEIPEDALLVAFVREYSPTPPAPSPALEERVLRAVRPRRVLAPWWGGGLAAAGIAAALILGIHPTPNPARALEPMEMVNEVTNPNPGIFAEDPATGLYDVRL
jgi:hypothetical protein